MRVLWIYAFLMAMVIPSSAVQRFESQGGKSVQVTAGPGDGTIDGAPPASAMLFQDGVKMVVPMAGVDPVGDVRVLRVTLEGKTFATLDDEELAKIRAITEQVQYFNDGQLERLRATIRATIREDLELRMRLDVDGRSITTLKDDELAKIRQIVHEELELHSNGNIHVPIACVERGTEADIEAEPDVLRCDKGGRLEAK